jgi:hypothetical protein
LKYWVETDLDYVDCVIATQGIMDNVTVGTFDAKMAKFIKTHKKNKTKTA